jgi:hypothetical protein
MRRVPGEDRGGRLSSWRKEREILTHFHRETLREISISERRNSHLRPETRCEE